MKQRILVTGGAGYIGSHTVIALYEAGFEPVIIDNFSTSSKAIILAMEEILNTNLELYEIDSCDQIAVNSVFSKNKLDGVIHFAAYKAVGESVANPMKYYTNNLNSLQCILRACKEYACPKFVFSSSCTVYGAPKSNAPITENSPQENPQSPYGWTKKMGEQIISDVCVTEEMNAVLLRYFNPIGAHPSGKIGELPQGKPNNILPFITQTVLGLQKELIVFGNDYETPDGTCVRDFVHVCDVADAHVRALNVNFEQNPQILNIGTGTGTSVAELIGITEAVTGEKLPVKWGKRRPGDVPSIFANVKMSEEKMNWKSKRSIASAIEDALRWEKYRVEKQLS
jgi:UDP-glucose 4-epimerase